MSKFLKRMQPLASIVCIILLFALSLLYYPSFISITTTKATDNPKKLRNKSITAKRNLNVVVHLDLKGMPPKLKYLELLLVTLKRHGATGLLLEYEDTFPFEGKLANLSVAYHYEKNELKRFLQAAVNSGLEIIPLIQTFGHMEYVLKHEEYQHLREQLSRPDSLCPSQSESLMFIKEILTQVVGFHQSISPLKHVHIGSDKASIINTCEFCTKRNLSIVDLYLNHLEKVADMVQNLAPAATALIWMDMFHSRSEYKRKSLNNCTKRFDNIEVVHWWYSHREPMPLRYLENVHSLFFSNTWIASAFKSVHALHSVLPNVYDRALNTLSWITNIRKYWLAEHSTEDKLKGIILTGWSRYNHFGPVLDLLVPSTPSLLMDLTIIDQCKIKLNDGENIDYSELMNNVSKYIKNILKCDHNDDIPNDLTSCKFEGHELYTVLYRYVENLKNIKIEVDHILPFVKAKAFSKKDESSNPNLKGVQAWCVNTKEKISNYTKELVSSMAPYYEKESIAEYANSKLFEASQTIYMCDTLNW